mmetsp:Transcript_9151/g.41698  ORF Transcript_9151/g.41698 Transcript_9151/m.41698 type:complete len:201 (+) Transcript_9151:1270-1872(+)
MPGHRLPRPDAGEGDVYFGLIVFPLLSHTHERDARRERARGGIGAAHIARVVSVSGTESICINAVFFVIQRMTRGGSDDSHEPEPLLRLPLALHRVLPVLHRQLRLPRAQRAEPGDGQPPVKLQLRRLPFTLPSGYHRGFNLRTRLVADGVVAAPRPGHERPHRLRQHRVQRVGGARVLDHAQRHPAVTALDHGIPVLGG